MANEVWTTLPFTEAVLVNPSIRLTKGAAYPFVEMAAVDPNTRSVHESEIREFKGSGARFMPGDTLMARITPCLENGKIARFQPTNGTRAGFGSTEFIVIRGRDGITDNDFAYYLTKWSEFRQFAISQMTGSSGRQHVPVSSLAHFEVIIPPISVQRRIAHILGTLDDKIELNRKMNQTLEAIARAIFKSWFVDFDPVIDNALAAGKPIPDEFADRAARRARLTHEGSSLPENIRRLFPDEFQDSELGPIPKGWEISPLARIASLQTKIVHPHKHPNKVWEHYSIPAFDAEEQPKWERGNTIKSSKYAVSMNCVLVSKLNPQFSRIWLPDVTNPSRAICSTEFMPFVPVKDHWRSYLYELFRSPTVQEEIKIRVSGSTGSRQRVKPKEIAGMPVVVPPLEVIDAFCNVTICLHQRVLKNQMNSVFLKRIRDLLLPRLLNGEIGGTGKNCAWR